MNERQEGCQTLRRGGDGVGSARPRVVYSIAVIPESNWATRCSHDHALHTAAIEDGASRRSVEVTCGWWLARRVPLPAHQPSLGKEIPAGRALVPT